jgi:hypothetical protein
MFKRCYALSPLLLLTVSVLTPMAGSAAQLDLDPDALAILKATVGTITDAKAFSVRVRVSRDRQATNNQLITYFNDDHVTVSRPNKVRIDVDGEHHDVQFFYDGNKATLFDPETKLYASQSAPGTIDSMLQAVEQRKISFPMSNLLQSNPYPSLIDGLQNAYIVGRVNIDKKTFIHLVFTEASADWQLWVEPGEKPLPRGMSIVYKSEPGTPRITMDFSDWNLNAQPEADMFEFVKPDGAHEIQFFPVKAGK